MLEERHDVSKASTRKAIVSVTATIAARRDVIVNDEREREREKIHELGK